MSRKSRVELINLACAFVMLVCSVVLGVQFLMGMFTMLVLVDGNRLRECVAEDERNGDA